LYISGANHSQFNTDWGLRDISFPTGILLNSSDFMSGVEQRMIAKVYISAFMETTLHQQEQYIPLFRDSREAQSLLPDTTYVNQYEDGNFTMWTRFEEDTNRGTLPNNGRAEGKNIIWREEETKNRGKSNKNNHVLVLERNNPEQQESVYSMNWAYGAKLPVSRQPQTLSFSLADQSKEVQPVPDAINNTGLSVYVELTDIKGVKSRIPLSRYRQLPTLQEVQFTIHPWFELHMSDGKYNNPAEAIFQTYQLPIADFKSANPEFNPDKGIKSLSFILIDGPGKIMLDDIGIY
jgi:hypothetical protein